MLSTSTLPSSQFLGLRVATTSRPPGFSAGAPASPSSPTALRSPGVSAAYAPVTEPTSFYHAPTSPRRLSPTSPSSFYEVLGVPAGATGQEIKGAYRRLALDLHPDVTGGVSGDDFMRINAAYAMLSDPDRRAEYDRTLMIRAPRGYGHSPGSAVEWTPPSPSSAHTASSSAFAAASGSGRRQTYSRSSTYPRRSRRTWETDQCW